MILCYFRKCWFFMIWWRFNKYHYHLNDCFLWIVLIEELFQLLARNPQYTAGQHSLNCGLWRTAIEKCGVVAHKLALKREPRNMCLVVAHAIFYIFETSFSDKSEPPCRVTLTLQLVTLAVSYLFTLQFAELPKYLQIQAIIVEFLFHCRRICW